MKEIHRRKPTAAPTASLEEGIVGSPTSTSTSSGNGSKRPRGTRLRAIPSPLFRSTWAVAAVALACLIAAAIVANPKIARKDKSKSLSNASSSSSAASVRSNPKIDPNTGSGAAKDEDVEYHVIFSTGCTTIQDWQSYVFFYYAMVSKQPGTITRVASGCTPEDEGKLLAFFNDKIATMAETPGKFRIHFTPDYSRLKPGPWYKYFNKPYGTKHWLEHALGFPDKPINEDAIVILMDPDQIILRPFRNNNFTNTVWTHLPPGVTQPRTKIEHGHPMGQRYGFGLQWRSSVDAKKLLGEGVDSPLLHLSKTEANLGYVVGPPYIATARDMYKIASQWSTFVVPIHDQYPELLAEMFAYCHAAAHVGLPHQIAARCVANLCNGE
jgi:peptidyl serine alpha-galactosyltransferase